MSRLRKADLLNIVLAALSNQGWTYPDDLDTSRTPLEFECRRGDVVTSLRIYIWNITHGGGSRRAADEYRIQITGVTPPLLSDNPQTQTLLLGHYRSDTSQSVIVAWDARKHNTFGYSPSLQIKFDALEQAVHDGIAVYQKEASGENAIAMVPDLLSFYILNQQALHDQATSTGSPTIVGPVVNQHPLELTISDVQVDDLVLAPRVLENCVAALNAGKHLILIGPPGTAKTTLAIRLVEAAARKDFSSGILSGTATTNWSTFDTIGGYIPGVDGTLIFQPGIFLRSIENNRWLLIDEMNRADIDKAFGEFFTVLSGASVTLPFTDNGTPIVILPPDGDTVDSTINFRVPPSWRMIGTMNTYDKTSLYELSYAFMRRFAFVNIGIPEQAQYQALIERFFDEAGLTNDVAQDLIKQSFSSDMLLKLRQCGPAIAKDVVSFCSQFLSANSNADPAIVVAEGLIAFVFPQFEGMQSAQVRETGKIIESLFEKHEEARAILLRSLDEMFPYVQRRNQMA